MFWVLGTYALLKDLHLFVLFLIETYKTLLKEATFYLWKHWKISINKENNQVLIWE
jgi:hypothetical protein